MRLSISLALVVLATVSVVHARMENIVCTDPATKIDRRQINRAILAICGGIQGAIQKCQGNPTTTTGRFQTALFDVNPTTAGATINVSKGRWERGVFAALDKCGSSPFTGTIPGGASQGSLNVKLTKV